MRKGRADALVVDLPITYRRVGKREGEKSPCILFFVCFLPVRMSCSKVGMSLFLMDAFICLPRLSSLLFSSSESLYATAHVRISNLAFIIKIPLV